MVEIAALVVYLNRYHNTASPASTSLLSDHLPLSSLNMWGSDPYACCLSKPTHRHKQLLPRLQSSKVTWSNTPGSMPHSPRIPHVLCPQSSLRVTASLACIVRWRLTFKVQPKTKVKQHFFLVFTPKIGCSLFLEQDTNSQGPGVTLRWFVSQAENV